MCCRQTLAISTWTIKDTATHIEQSKLLLRSIKNVAIADNDDEIDVTYDKALSRRLLNENVVLRRDAEMKAKFPPRRCSPIWNRF
jgi:hypothetical protein